MDMDSDNVVNNILKKENALRLLDERRATEENQTPAADEPGGGDQDVEATVAAPGAAVAVEPTVDENRPVDAATPDADATGSDAEEARASQEAQMAELERVRGVAEGKIVEGTVVQIDPDGVLVDVGAKSEGMIRAPEFARGELERLKLGDKIAVFVIKADDDEESIQLSKKKADYEISWQRILGSYEKGEIVECAVTDRVKGGLRVDLGVMGFIPASHVGVRNPNDLDRFVGEIVSAKIIEVDRNRKKVILSRRLAEKVLREERKGVIMGELREGQVRDGIVRNITSYGAFVDLGGVDGLLHVTEMSWVHVKHPEEVVKPGDEIRVMVLKVDRERERISLGLKQLLPDPWDEVKRNYKVSQTITVAVSRCVASGAFVKLPEGVEAFIPIGELAERRINKPEDAIAPGQTVEAKIINLQPRQRRMSLSVIQAASQRYLDGTANEVSNVTIGDRYGDLLKQAVQPEQAEAEPEQAEPEPEQAEAKAEQAEPEPEQAAQEPEQTDQPSVPAEEESAPAEAEKGAAEDESTTSA